MMLRTHRRTRAERLAQALAVHALVSASATFFALLLTCTANDVALVIWSRRQFVLPCPPEEVFAGCEPPLRTRLSCNYLLKNYYPSLFDTSTTTRSSDLNVESNVEGEPKLHVLIVGK